jgi:hypothetical protein
MREGWSTERCLNELQLLFHLHRIEKHPIMRYVGFTTEITIKTAGAPHSFVEFVERNVYVLLAGHQCLVVSLFHVDSLWGDDSQQ